MPQNNIDIVALFEKYSYELNWKFSYGNKANQNLLDSNFDAEQVYMLLDPVNRTRTFNEYGGSDIQAFSGSFLLVVKSTMDLTYHNQTEEEAFVNRTALLDGSFTVTNTCIEVIPKPGKYELNIKPMLNVQLPLIEDKLNCSEYEIKSWSIVDVVDLFDVNVDGVVVTYNVSVL